MKTRLFVALLLGTVALLSVACARQNQLQHEPAAGQQLAGRWQLVQNLETQVATDESNPQLVTGTVNSTTTTFLTFHEDQTFSLESAQEFLSYTPAEGVEPVPEDVVREYFSQTMRVTGTYIATSQLLEYDQAEVSVNGGEPVTFEELVATGVQMGERVQRVAWTMQDDKLTVIMAQGREAAEVVYTRVR